MIHRRAKGRVAAAVMSRHRETLESELLHQRDTIGSFALFDEPV